jgi:hypothetical protein
MTAAKKKVFKWVLLSVLIILITGGFAGYQMYTKPHRNVEHAKALTVSALKLATEYEVDEPLANSQYLDKVLEVDGEVSQISKNQKAETVIALKGTDMGTVRCTVEGSQPEGIVTGAKVVIKGICTGYLTDVIMVRCVLQNK